MDSRGKVIGAAVLVVVVVVLGCFFLFRDPVCSIVKTEPKVDATDQYDLKDDSITQVGFLGYLKFKGDNKYMALNLDSVEISNKSGMAGSLTLEMRFDCANMTMHIAEDLSKKEFKSLAIIVQSEKVGEDEFRCENEDGGLLNGSKGTPARKTDVYLVCKDLNLAPTGDVVVIKFIYVDLYYGKKSS